MSPSEILGEGQSDYARGFVKGKKTSMKCGSNPNRVGNLSMSPMQPCVMKQGIFKVSLEYVQDIQPYREIDTDFYRGLE